MAICIWKNSKVGKYGHTNRLSIHSKEGIIVEYSFLEHGTVHIGMKTLF